ncbi:MAG: OmpH family outer membrane protein [Fimbriimonadales bacterium]|nr:OmpH family outer membrane protein [Fimbriimonadales bacterium]
MSTANGATGGREPIFRDVPLEESEWRGLYEVLRQVNQPKAELMRAQYESTRTAYRNFLQAREEELKAYQQRRQEDEAYNRETDTQRQQLLEKVEAIRARWWNEIERLRQELKEAEVEARRRAARAGINLKGDLFLGIGLTETAEFVQGSSPATTQVENAEENTSSSLPNSGGVNPPAPAEATAPANDRNPSTAQAAPADTIEPLTPEEAAHAARLPTDHSPLIPLWLYWLACGLVGVGIGLLALVALGRPFGDWQMPWLWIAALGGALAMWLWCHALWGVGRAVSELLYLFDWGAARARRIAWLVGGLLLVLMMLPLALLASIALLPNTGRAELQLLAALLLIVVIPLLGLALVGGYFQGRARVIHNAVQSAVVAARREQQRAGREGKLFATSPPADADAPSTAGEPSPPPPRSDGAFTKPSNGATPPEAESSASSSAESQRLLQAAYEAIGVARGIWQNFNRAQEMMQTEMAPYEQMLRELQRRPIYDYLPPWAEQRLQMLYQQWSLAYAAFLDCVAEAVRECKDGAQIQQRITEFKQTLLR